MTRLTINQRIPCRIKDAEFLIIGILGVQNNSSYNEEKLTMISQE